MVTGPYTRWDLNSETGRFTPRQNKTHSFEKMVITYFQRTRLACKIESFFTTRRQKKFDCYSADGSCSHCKTVFEAMSCFYHFCPCEEVRPSPTEENIQRGSKKKESSMHWDYTSYSRKASIFLKCGSANGGDWTRQSRLLTNISENNFLTGVQLQLSNY